ncbi:M23 family metallopeptidase [Solibacillus sp. CAU 1738]|uniref:M23 family metallopeptidase n=1 Tax=Solibacillus sp. CAU 1738 TaxID=3140363 RepID=UPI003260FA97
MSSKWNIKKDSNIQYHSLLKRQSNLLKKTSIAALLLLGLTLNVGFSKEVEGKNSFSKIYHIYANDAYIGAVSNLEAVEMVITEKEQQVSEKYDELFVDAHSNIEVVPEQVFQASTNDADILAKLKQALVVEAEAYALQVSGETVAYVKDEAEYEKALNLLKLEYVTQEELDALNNNKDNTQLRELKKNETRILEVSILEPVEGEATKAKPTEILNAEEAVELLQTGTLEKEVYTVQAGDVLGSIAKEHELKTSELLELNPSISDTTVLQIGQELNVTVNKPLVTVKVVEEKSKVETIDYAHIVEENARMPKGEKKVIAEGAEGKKEVSYLITLENGERTERVVTNEEITQEPENRVVEVGTKVIPSRGTGSFSWPTNGGYISSNVGERWGAYHRGIDIARPSNYTIKSADNGVVTFTGWDGTYGNKIVVNHNNGYETIYAHLSQIDVSVGQVVEQGSAIAVMGSTGNSTGTHLHFEIHKNGALVNPLSYLP